MMARGFYMVQEIFPSQPAASDRLVRFGRELRPLYDDVVREPLPERFAVLVRRLERAARG